MNIHEGSKKAIIISVSDYDILQPLEFCKNDGNEMYGLLKSLNYEIPIHHKLIGRVNWIEMRSAIIDFFRNSIVKASDTLLFYYSGHGILDNGDHYLAPSETDPFVPDKNGFLFEELTRLMNKSHSRKVVTILDCCYSGAARLGKGNADDAAKLGRATIDDVSNKLERGEGKCILAASQSYQRAFETAEQDHSLFTYYLLEGLRGKQAGAIDDEGCVTPYSLSKYVYNTIMSLPPEKRPIQKPVRKVEESGDIVLAYYPQFARTSIDTQMLRPNTTSSKGSFALSREKYRKPRKLPKNIPSYRNSVYEERLTEPLVIDSALPVNVPYESVTGLELANRKSLTISKTTLSFIPYYVFDYELHTARLDRAGKYHQIKDEGTSIVDALNGKIINEESVLISKSHFRDFFSKIPQKPPDTEDVLKDMEEIQVIRDLTNIKSEFRYKAPRTSNYNLEVLEAKVPIKAAKSMIVAEIIEDKTQDISYKMKFADGRIEDREMTVIPKAGEIRISKASLIHIPKWVVIFKAKEFIYARKILAASNTKLMDELEYCPKHFSRWKVWEGKRPCYAICDVCGGAYCEDHISKVNDVYLCEEHLVHPRR